MLSYIYCGISKFNVSTLYIEPLIKYLLATTVPVPDEKFRLLGKDKFLVILDYKALVAPLTDLTSKCYTFIDPKRLQASKWSEL